MVLLLHKQLINSDFSSVLFKKLLEKQFKIISSKIDSVSSKLGSVLLKLGSVLLTFKV